jgi:hypothetical protein
MDIKNSLLDYNINIFFDNISKTYNIDRLDLEKFKDYNKENIEEYITSIKQVYLDRNNNKYILIEQNTNDKNKEDLYVAIKIEK